MRSMLRLVKYMTPDERRRYEARLLEYVRKVCREGGREVYESGDLVPLKAGDELRYDRLATERAGRKGNEG